MRRGLAARRARSVIAVAAAAGARANARAETEEARVADILQSALVKHGGEVNRCFEKALADTLDVAGKIELAVDVGRRRQGHQGRAGERRRQVAGAARLPARERRDLDAGRHRSRQHRDRAAGVRGPDGAVLHQGRGRARSRPARAGQQEGGRAGAAAAVLRQAAGRRGDDARAEGGADAADDRARQPDRDAQASRAPRCCTCSRATPASSGRRASRPRSSTRGWRCCIPAGMPHAIENMGRTASGGVARRVRAAWGRSASTAIRRTRRGAPRSR